MSSFNLFIVDSNVSEQLIVSNLILDLNNTVCLLDLIFFKVLHRYVGPVPKLRIFIAGYISFSIISFLGWRSASVKNNMKKLLRKFGYRCRHLEPKIRLKTSTHYRYS